MKRIGLTSVPIPETINLFAHKGKAPRGQRSNQGGTGKTLDTLNKILPKGQESLSENVELEMPIGPNLGVRFKEAGKNIITKDNRFVVEKGASPFFSSSGEGKGKFDANLRYDSVSGKWIQNYTFQESPLVAGHEMSVAGVWDNVNVDGKDMFAILLEDHTSKTQRFIARNQFEDVAEFFDKNLVPKGKENKERINFIKSDRARRYYESIFDTNYYGQEQSIARNLETAWDVIDNYQEEMNALKQKGMVEETPALKSQAIRNITDKFNQKQESDSQFLRSYDKIENTINASERLLAERPMWEQVINETSWINETGSPNSVKIKRQNAVFRNVQLGMEEAAGGTPKQEYGYKGMKRFKMPTRSHKNEYTYFNLESKVDFQTSLQNTLNTKTKGAGGVYLDTEHLLKQIHNIDDSEKQEIMKKIRKDISSKGQVESYTLEDIANRLYKPMSENSDFIVSSVPGTAIHSALNNGTSEIERYKNNLTSKVYPNFNRILDQANEQAKNQLSNGYLFQEFSVDHLSDPVRQKLTRTKDIISALDQTIVNSNKMYGFKQSGVRQIDPMDNIKNVVESFKDKDYTFSLDYSEAQDNVYLFFDSENKGNLNLSGLTFAEKLADDRVSQVILPLQTKDYLVPIQGQNVQDKLVMRLPEGYRSGQHNPMELVRTGDVAFENLSNVPNRIEQIMKWREEEGRPISRKEAAEQAISEYSRKTASRRVAGAHRGFNSPEGEGFKPGSVQKNLHGAATVDIGEMVEEVYRSTEPESYARFENWKEEVGLRNVRYVDSSFTDRELGEALNEQRNRLIGKATSIFNQSYGEGSEFGLHGTSLGVSAKQYQEGNISLVDIRSFTPMGEANPASREQITKQVNYMPLEEGPLAEYLTSRYGFDSAQRMLSPVESQNSAFANQVSEEGTVGVLSRTYFGSDSEINERVKEVLKETETELSEIEAKLVADKNNIGLLSRQADLLSDREILRSGRISVYEEQSVMRKSFMDSLVNRENLTISLDEGFELNDRLKSRLEEEIGGSLKTGRYDFENNLDVNEMRKIGILGEDDKLTVGHLMKNGFLEEGNSSGRSQRQRIYNGSSITGMEVLPNGQIEFALEQVRYGEDGMKLIEQFGGTRTTTMAIRDELMDRVFGNVDLVREHIKDSRYPAGQLFNVLTETSYQNAMEDVDRVFAGDAPQTAAVKRWAENTALDHLATEDDFRKSFMSNEFMPTMKKSGASMIELKEDGIGIIESPDLDINRFVGEEGFNRYKNLHQLAKEDYGFDPRYAITQTSLHNVPMWQGTGTQPRYGGREFNIIRQSLRHANISPENSQIMSRYSELANDNLRAKHVEYAKNIRKGLETFSSGATAENFEQAGNVIVDMTGEFSSKTGNIQTKTLADGSEFYVVDGLSIPAPAKGMAIGAEVEGTASDFMSVPLSSESGRFEDMTIGDLVKENNGQAVLKIEDSRKDGPRRFKQDVVPIMPQFDEYSLSEQVIQTDTNKKLESVYNSLYAFHELDFSQSSLTREQKEARIAYYIRQANTGLDETRFSMNKYLGGKGPANFTEGYQSFRAESGVSNLVSMRNPFANEMNWGINETAYSRKHVESMIRGNEQNILLANLEHVDWTESEILNMSKDELAVARETILDRVSGPGGDDEFELIGSLSRNPIQSEGSIIFTDVRVDEALEENTRQTSIGRVQAQFLGADSDGDTVYTMLDLYSGKLSPNEIKEVQTELKKMRGVYTKRLEEADVAFGGLNALLEDQPTDTFEKVANLTEEEKIRNLFGQFTGSGAEMGDIAVKATQIPGIGLIDNQMVGARNTMNQVYRGAMETGQIDTSAYNKVMDQWDRVNDNIVQNFISAKKMEVEDIFKDQLAELGDNVSFMELDESTQFNWITDYVAGRTNLPGQLSYMNTNNYQEIYENFDKLGILDGEIQIGEEMVDARTATYEAFGQLAAANDAIKGYENPKLGIGTRKNAEQLIRDIQESPERIMTSPELIHFSEALYGAESETHQKLVTVGQQQKESISKKVMSRLDEDMLVPTSSAQEGIQQFSDSIIEQVSEASTLAQKSTLERKVQSGNQTFQALQNIGRGVTSSTAFKVGAGAASIWALSAAVRKGPTPEGEEAEQEATAAEIDPSALLTTPTARVTPNAENIQLNISGRGNIDQEVLAGVVNREISGMTGTPMDMNIRTTDNVQKLDNRFFESKINKVLGI